MKKPYELILDDANQSQFKSCYITPDSPASLTLDASPRVSELHVGGRNILAELDEMRDALMLIKRDVDMEAKYPRLRELKDEYERELAKYKTFDTVKESK